MLLLAKTAMAMMLGFVFAILFIGIISSHKVKALEINGDSEYFGEFVDGLGLAEDDMDCVIINGKDHDELVEEMENDDEEGKGKL